jgi:TonB family protein
MIARFHRRVELVLAAVVFASAPLLSKPSHGTEDVAPGSADVVDIRGLWVKGKLDEKLAISRGLVPAALEAPAKMKDAVPEYPDALVRARIAGSVKLECRIDIDGVPRDCRVTKKAHEALNESALKAVQKWRYRPLKVGGTPRSALMEISVRFGFEYH